VTLKAAAISSASHTAASSPVNVNTVCIASPPQARQASSRYRPLNVEFERFPKRRERRPLADKFFRRRRLRHFEFACGRDKRSNAVVSGATLIP